MRALHVPPYLLPAPSGVFAALLANAPILASSAWNTLSMALWALVIASASALTIALAIALSPLAERSVRPVAVALQVTPIVAIAPLVNIWAGLDHPERAADRDLALGGGLLPDLLRRDHRPEVGRP